MRFVHRRARGPSHVKEAVMTRFGQTWRLAVAAAALVLVSTSPASATLKYGPLELSGNLQSQNIIRHSDIDEYHFVQQRNTFRARVDWNWLERGKLIDRIEIPFIESSKLFLL